jgi:archaemetzincin
MPPQQDTIIIAPIGNSESPLLEKISREVRHAFGFVTEIRPILDSVDFALDAGRRQYHSTSILNELARIVPSHALKVLAVADVDLFIPILTHVYGEALLGGAACVLSTFRLKEGLSPLQMPDGFHRRVVKEAIHELGHTFQLRHCKDPGCLMHYCRRIGDVDKKGNRLCRYCSVLLNDELKRLEKQT